MLNFERKTNSLFMIYTHLESILVPEDNEQQKHVPCSYGYKYWISDDGSIDSNVKIRDHMRSLSYYWKTQRFCT